MLNLSHYLNAISVVRSYMKKENALILKVVVMSVVNVVVITNLNWNETLLRQGFVLSEPLLNPHHSMA